MHTDNLTTETHSHAISVTKNAIACCITIKWIPHNIVNDNTVKQINYWSYAKQINIIIYRTSITQQL